MHPRVLLVGLGLASACAGAPVPPARPPPPPPWSSYASAIEEAVFRYEHEADVAVRHARPVRPGRYEELLRRTLRARGLTLEELRAASAASRNLRVPTL